MDKQLEGAVIETATANVSSQLTDEQLALGDVLSIEEVANAFADEIAQEQ